MKDIQLEDEVFAELAKMSQPLVDTASTVVSKLMKFYKKHNNAQSPNGIKLPTKRTRTKKADFRQYIVPRFQDMIYAKVLQKLFKEGTRPMMGIKEITVQIFEFPNKVDKELIDRAEVSILNTLRHRSEIFSEPSPYVFELK